jgi:chromosome segregation ATPase
MSRRFLRLFKEYRELEERREQLEERREQLEKRREQDEAVMASMNRYIEALEGRDRERLECINGLGAAVRETRAVIKALRADLTGLCPNRKEEP